MISAQIDVSGRAVGLIERPERFGLVPGAVPPPPLEPEAPLTDWRWDGEAWLLDPRPAEPEPDPAQLVAQRLAASIRRGVAAINASAGDLRRVFVTDLPAQEMIYLKKEAEAARYIGEAASGTPPDLATYHWLPHEIGITAPSAEQLAQVWLNLAAIWQQVGPLIEEARLGTIAQIEGAADLASVEAAVTAGQAALAALRAAAAGAAA